MKNIFRILLLTFSIFCLGEDCNAQLYKQWGFWLTDTIPDEANYLSAELNSIVSDENNNIYIQYYNPKNGFDTVTIKSFTPEGQLRWSKNYFNPEDNVYNNRYNGRLFYHDGVLISIIEFYKDNKFYLRFRKISSHGVKLKNVHFEMPDSVDVLLRHNYIQTSNNTFYFTGMNKVQDELSIVKIDISDSTIISKNYLPVLGKYTSTIPAINFINDSLIVFSGIAKNGTTSTTYSHQITIIKKSDLSIFATLQKQGNTAPNAIHPLKNDILTIGEFSYVLDIHGKLKKSTQTNISKVIKGDANNYYTNYSPSASVHIRNMDSSGNFIWDYQETNSSTENHHVNDIMVSEDLVVNSTKSKFTGQVHLGQALFKSIGIKTTVLSKYGQFEDEFYLEFDSVRGRMDRYISTLDNDGNIIILSKYYHKTKGDTLSKLPTIGALYFYKICQNCETNTPPIVEIKFENYITIQPNPTIKNTLTYSVGIVTPDRLGFYLYDMNGKLLYCERYKNYIPGQHQKQIDLNQLGITAGHYILTMRTSYNHYSTKFAYAP